MAASPDSAAAPTARRRKGLAQVLLLVAESGFVALILVEVLLRLTTQSVPALEPRRFALVDAHGVATPVRQMPVVDHALPPGATLRLSYDAAGAPDHPYLVTEGAWQHLDAPLNARGFRGPLPEEPKRRPRVACVGDSFTFGDGVLAADGFVSRLRTARPELEVLNYGVPGLDLAQVADQLEARVLADAPDRVLYAMTLNDVPAGALEGQAERVADAELAFRRSLDEPRGLARFSSLAALVQRRARLDSTGASYEEVVRTSFEGAGWEALLLQLERLDRDVRAAGADLTVVLFPLLVRLDGDYPFEALHERIAEACAARGIEHLDLLPAFRGERASELWVHPTDQHPNPRGHALAAEAIEPLLLRP